MLKFSIILVAITTVLHQAQAAQWGPSLHSGFNDSTIRSDPNPKSLLWIREANTTLVLPAVPNGVAPSVVLWPGMLTSNGDLIQGMAIAGQECGGMTDQWCIMASTLKNGTDEINGHKVPASEKDHITFHYKFNDETHKIDQTVFRNGKPVSKISTNSGLAYNFQLQTECRDQGCSSLMDVHEYRDTTLRFCDRNTGFGHTLKTRWIHTPGFYALGRDNFKTWKMSSAIVYKTDFWFNGTIGPV